MNFNLYESRTLEACSVVSSLSLSLYASRTRVSKVFASFIGIAPLRNAFLAIICSKTNVPCSSSALDYVGPHTRVFSLNGIHDPAHVPHGSGCRLRSARAILGASNNNQLLHMTSILRAFLLFTALLIAPNPPRPPCCSHSPAFSS